jgi:hypothetical protein
MDIVKLHTGHVNIQHIGVNSIYFIVLHSMAIMPLGLFNYPVSRYEPTALLLSIERCNHSCLGGIWVNKRSALPVPSEEIHGAATYCIVPVENIIDYSRSNVEHGFLKVQNVLQNF